LKKQIKRRGRQGSESAIFYEGVGENPRGERGLRSERPADTKKDYQKKSIRNGDQREFYPERKREDSFKYPGSAKDKQGEARRGWIWRRKENCSKGLVR